VAHSCERQADQLAHSRADIQANTRAQDGCTDWVTFSDSHTDAISWTHVKANVFSDVVAFAATVAGTHAESHCNAYSWRDPGAYEVAYCAAHASALNRTHSVSHNGASHELSIANSYSCANVLTKRRADSRSDTLAHDRTYGETDSFTHAIADEQSHIRADDSTNTWAHTWTNLRAHTDANSSTNVGSHHYSDIDTHAIAYD
jgi:hypothetical protein